MRKIFNTAGLCLAASISLNSVASPASPASMTMAGAGGADGFAPVASQNGHELYAKPVTLAALGPLADEILMMARSDVIFVDPDHFEEADYASFMSLPAFADYGKIFPEEDITDKDSPAEKTHKENGNREVRALAEELRQSFFTANVKKAALLSGGGNYITRLHYSKDGETAACMITADMTVENKAFARLVGEVPEKLETAKVVAGYSDVKSLLTFVLLHEAAHCAQGRAAQEAAEENMQIDILKFEIEADKKAIARYRELQEKDPSLDPQLPQKIKTMRRLAPYLNNGDSATDIFTIMQYKHMTAEALEADSYDASALENAVLNNNMAIKSVIYDTLDPVTRAEFEAAVVKELEPVLSALQENVMDTFEDEGDTGKMRDFAEKFLAAYQNIVVKLAVADKAQKENPALTYAAMRLINNRHIAPEMMMGKNFAVNMKDALRSWHDMGFAEDGKLARDLERAFGPRAGHRLTTDDLSILKAYKALPVPPVPDLAAPKL